MTTNREWLYSLDVADLADWFDAQHVDANDALSAENDVSAESVDANDGFMDLDSCTHGARTFASEADSREKLEADIRAWRGEPITVFTAINGWLDRQAVITRREVLTQPDERDEQLAELTAQLYELTAERDALADDLQNCNREREHYRELFSKAITHAHEIVNLQP